jgi:hypothetical protein
MKTQNNAAAFPAQYLLILIGSMGLLLSFSGVTKHVDALAEIGGQPLFAAQYYVDQKMTQALKGDELGLDKTDFIHRHLLIHAAKRHGYTVTPTEIKRFIQASPPNFQEIFTTSIFTTSINSASESMLDATRQQAQKFIIESILANKMRDKLLLKQHQELPALKATFKTKVIPAGQIKVEKPSKLKLYSYYCDHIDKYKLEQYQLRMHKFEQSSPLSPAVIAAQAAERYRKNPLDYYQSEQRSGYIVQGYTLATHKSIFKSLQKSPILPTSLQNCVREKLKRVGENVNASYGQALFLLDLKNKYYKIIGPQRYLVLTEVIPAKKINFKSYRAQISATIKMLDEGQQDLKKKKKALLAHADNVTKFLTAKRADTVTIDAVTVDDYSIFKPMVSFLQENKATYGIVPISHNIDYVFELIDKSSRTLSFTEALPQVKKHYLVADRDRIVQAAYQRVLTNLPLQASIVTWTDSDLPEDIKFKMLAAPLSVIEYGKIEDKYYIFQKLTSLTIEQLFRSNPLYELSVFKELKRQYKVTIMPTQKNAP